jgi:PLP dependent protein
VTDLTDHLASVRTRVRGALERAGRAPDDALIVAVSKQQTSDAIQAAYRAGQRHFGESYAQEAKPKIESLRQLDAVWHFIGRIQSNKTRAVAESFQWVHTVDRQKVAARLNEQRPPFAPPLNVLIQVNLGNEKQKGGVEPEAVLSLAAAVSAEPRLVLRGLMAIPPADASDPERRAQFGQLRSMNEQLVAAGYAVDTLSMGMSDDFELAIACGSNCVRIGTAIFGVREK